jgi:hypothetical protein
MGFGILAGLILAAVIPIAAAKGKGWRGLWFGLAVPALLIAVFIGSSPVQTKSEIEAQLGHAINDRQYEVMEGLDSAALAISSGACLGCVIGGAVFRKRAA